MKNKLYEWTKEANLKCYRCQQSQLNSCHTENENEIAQSGAPLITEKIPTRNESIFQQTILENWKTDLLAFQVWTKEWTCLWPGTFQGNRKSEKSRWRLVVLILAAFLVRFRRPAGLVLSLWLGWSQAAGTRAEVKILLKLASLRGGVKTHP